MCVAASTAGLRRESDFYASPSRFITPQAADDSTGGSAAVPSSAVASEASVVNRANSWSPAHVAFTARDAIFEYRTIMFNFDDEALPGMLRAAVEVSARHAGLCRPSSSSSPPLSRLPGLMAMVAQSDERLLHLYEGGLPTWAIYAPKMGLPYRPWLRTVTWLLFVAVSVFSLLSGFYDLYRHFPVFEQVRPEATDVFGPSEHRMPIHQRRTAPLEEF